MLQSAAADLDYSFDSDILQGKLAISPLLTLPWPLVSHVPLGFCFILHLPPPLLPPVWLLDHLTSLPQTPQQAHQKFGKRNLEDSLCQTTLCHHVYFYVTLLKMRDSPSWGPNRYSQEAPTLRLPLNLYNIPARLWVKTP